METCADGYVGVTESCTDLAEAFGKSYRFSMGTKKEDKKCIL